MWDRIARNAFSNMAGTAVGLAVGFVTMPLVVRHLGPTDFGLWMLATGLTGYMGLLDVGLAPTLIKKSAELLAHRDAHSQTELSELASTVYAIYAVAGAVGLLLLGGLGLIADHTFNLPPGEVETFRTVLLLVAVQTAIGLPMSTWNGLLAGLEAFPFINAVGITTSLVRGVLTVALVWTGQGLVQLVAMGFGVSVLGWTLSRLAVRRWLPALRVGIGGFRVAQLPAIGHFSWAMLAWTVAGAALHQLDRVLIGVFLPIRSLATYEVGSRLANYSRLVLHSWLAIVMPAASGLAARGERGRLRGLFLRGTRYLVGCYTGVALLLLGFGGPFIRVWMGPEYDQSFIIMALLLTGSVVQSQTVVAHVMLPAVGELHVFTRFMQLYPLVTTPLAVGGIFFGGLTGLAFGITLSIVVMETIFIVVALPRLGVRPGELFRRCHGPIGRAVLCVAPCVVALRSQAAIVTWGEVIAAVTATGVLYVLAVWAFGLTRGERRLLQRRLQTIGTRRVPVPALRGEPSC